MDTVCGLLEHNGILPESVDIKPCSPYVGQVYFEVRLDYGFLDHLLCTCEHVQNAEIIARAVRAAIENGS